MRGLHNDYRENAYLHGLWIGYQAALASPEAQYWKRDSELLNTIQSECWDVRFISTPNGDAGDSNVGIEIVAHFMDKPHERVIGENYTEDLRGALEQAMTADAYPPGRPEYDGDAAMEKLK